MEGAIGGREQRQRSSRSVDLVEVSGGRRQPFGGPTPAPLASRRFVLAVELLAAPYARSPSERHARSCPGPRSKRACRGPGLASPRWRVTQLPVAVQEVGDHEGECSARGSLELSPGHGRSVDPGLGRPLSNFLLNMHLRGCPVCRGFTPTCCSSAPLTQRGYAEMPS